jgi:hypothetical protein
VAQRKWWTTSKEVRMNIAIGIIHMFKFNSPPPPLFYVCPACDKVKQCNKRRSGDYSLLGCETALKMKTAGSSQTSVTFQNCTTSLPCR